MIELPDLDDRTFAALAAEARNLIPTFAPAWTDHNPTDPGIVLVELFAWLVEIVLYRLDRVPDKSYRTFLGLLREPGAGDLPPDLDAAIRETLLPLRERHRAITTDDFVELARDRWPEQQAAKDLGVPGIVRRALCLGEWQQTATGAVGASAPAHYTLVVVPDCLAESRSDLPAFSLSRAYALELSRGGFVDCGNDSTLAITGALTLSAWIFPRALDVRQTIVAKGTSGEFELALETTGVLSFHQVDGKDGGSSDPATRVPVGRWTHVAAARASDGKSVQFFIDGREAGTAPLATKVMATTNAVRIGGGSADGFDGFVRDVAIWNEAFDETTIAGELRQEPFAGDWRVTMLPIACWKLDSASQDRIAPDAATPATATSRPRDGQLMPPPPNATTTPLARWRDVIHPLPAAAPLLDGLSRFLDEWRLLTSKLHVIGYRPLPVIVTATIYLRSDGRFGPVNDAAHAAIDRFLDALRGWRGEGWPFGRAIYQTDLAAVIDSLPGIEFVEDVKVLLADPTEPGRPPPPTQDDGTIMGIALHPHELPALSSVNFTLLQRVRNKWEPAT